jgi:hypothetical protein
MEPAIKPKICFILGVIERSGTNFLYSLLGGHPSCAAPGPIWEDHFLQHSRTLIEYTSLLYKTWNPTWEVEKKIGGPEKLLREFGDAIEHFLRRQLLTESANNPPPQILLTKTPSVVGLNNFFDLFPDAYLILLVRDGRAVVESGVRSFDWNYEDAMWKWRAGAQAIINFEERHKKTDKRYVILKYEDLVMNERSELLKLFDFLGVEPALFDFNSTEALGVIGSSESRKQAAAVSWDVTIDKNSNFNPLFRFDNWDSKKRERFSWIAGEQMTRLGYELNPIKGNEPLYSIRHKLRDVKKFLKDIITSRKQRHRRASNMVGRKCS